MTKRRQHENGLTLIEFLIYAVITGMMLAEASALMVNVFESTAHIEAVNETNRNAALALDLLRRKIGEADSINEPLSGEAGASLSLAVSDPSRNPTVIEASDGTLFIREGGGAAIAVTSSSVSVGDARFTNVSSSGAKGTVRMELLLESGTRQIGRSNFRETLYETVHIR